MLSYLIVGSGYRAEYFGRIAARYPALFRALYLCRSPEKAALMTERTSVAATTALPEALAFGADFAVVAVDRAHIADVAAEWAERGLPVVAETPIGASRTQLERIWRLGQSGAKLVCCEQYHRYPILARGLESIRQGLIGQPCSAYLSLAHDYHGISLIRRLLGTDGEPYVLHAVRTTSQVAATDSRYEAILDGSRAEEARDVVHVAFASGKTAVYDFSPIQYRSFIRARHLTVRGERGEWSDRVFSYVDTENLPQRIFLMPEIAPAYRSLDTQALRDLRKTWTPELFLDTAQDEFAIASILLDMEGYLKGGPSPYPLAEALDDAWFWLQAQAAVETPFAPVLSGPVPWREEGSGNSAEAKP